MQIGFLLCNGLSINCWYKQREFKEQSTSFGPSGPPQTACCLKIYPNETCSVRETDRHIMTRKLYPPILKYSSPEEACYCSSVPLLIRCPHGNNNLALDARVLGACWGIICTSSWTPSSTLHWMTGGRHRSAKCRDWGATPDGNEFKQWHFAIKENLSRSPVCQSHLKVWWRPRRVLVLVLASKTQGA